MEKIAGIDNTLDPAITVSIISATGTTLAAIITGIFALLRDKRNKRDHRATVINIGNNWLQHRGDDDESFSKQEIIKISRRAFQEKEDTIIEQLSEMFRNLIA